MNNNDYHTRAWTHHILREYRAERKKQAETADAVQEAEFRYETFSDDLLTYPIFFNQASGYHNAQPLRDAHYDADYAHRWLHFCPPDMGKLPHRAYLQRLIAEKSCIDQQQAALNAPRLVIFTAAFAVVALLASQGNFVFALLVITALAWFWSYTEAGIRHGQQRLADHEAHLRALHAQHISLEAQLAGLPDAAPPHDLHTAYQSAVEQLLRRTLRRLVPSAELGDLPQCLRHRHYQAFALESWGVLQLPLHAPPALHASLLDGTQPSLLAFQQAGDRGQPTYRITYLQIWVLTEQGLLAGSGYYDRVGGQFLHLQQDFHPYAQLALCRFSEQILPAMPALQARLAETVYHRYLNQPVPVMRLTLDNGEQLACAGLPALESHSSHFPILAGLELCTDLAHLNRLLHERMQGAQAVAA